MNSFTTTQKIRSFGTSHGIVLPAKELRALGLSKDDNVRVLVQKEIKPADDQKVLEIAQSILKKYDQAFKDLADR